MCHAAWLRSQRLMAASWGDSTRGPLRALWLLWLLYNKARKSVSMYVCSWITRRWNKRRLTAFEIERESKEPLVSRILKMSLLYSFFSRTTKKFLFTGHLGWWSARRKAFCLDLAIPWPLCNDIYIEYSMAQYVVFAPDFVLKLCNLTKKSCIRKAQNITGRAL